MDNIKFVKNSNMGADFERSEKCLLFNQLIPGEILREDFLKPMGITPYRLAKDIGVPVNRITAIIREQRRISAETALLLSRYFGVSDSMWSNLQAHYNLEVAKDALGEKLKTIPTRQHPPPVPPLTD